MPLNNAPVYKAAGTIPPHRFVKMDTSQDHAVVVAAAGTDDVCGVSQIGMKRQPGLAGSDTAIAAENGDAIEVFTLGDVCALESGAAFTAGALLMSDSVGRGITATASGTSVVGARAIEAAGAAGSFVLVQILSRKL